jgi:hypothetical protein
MHKASTGPAQPLCSSQIIPKTPSGYPADSYGARKKIRYLPMPTNILYFHQLALRRRSASTLLATENLTLHDNWGVETSRRQRLGGRSKFLQDLPESGHDFF